MLGREKERHNTNPSTSRNRIPPHKDSMNESVDNLTPTNFLVLNSNNLSSIASLGDSLDVCVDWMRRSLTDHAEITLLGVDPFLADITSLLLISEREGYGKIERLETYTIEESAGHPKSCIEASLRSYLQKGSAETTGALTSPSKE